MHSEELELVHEAENNTGPAAWKCGSCEAYWWTFQRQWRKRTKDGDLVLNPGYVANDRCDCGAPRPSKPSILEAELESERAMSPGTQSALADAAEDDFREVQEWRKSPVVTEDDDSRRLKPVKGRPGLAVDTASGKQMRIDGSIDSESAQGVSASTEVYCRKGPIPEGGTPCNCIRSNACYAEAMGLRKPPGTILLEQRLSEIQGRIETSRQMLDRVHFGNIRSTASTVREMMTGILNSLEDD